MSRSSADQANSPFAFWKTALLITAHHVGTVFESASGKRFPRLVESTMMDLQQTSTLAVCRMVEHQERLAYPPNSIITSKNDRLGLRRGNLH